MKRMLLIALMVLGCASTPAARLQSAIQIPLHVENNVSRRMTIYATPDGTKTRRVGDCEGLRTCMFVLDERTSQYAISKGLLELGFRHFGDPGRGITTFVSTPAWAGMQANLVVNYTDTYIIPRQAIEAD
ncbi:MAG: hypothetical protein V3S55_09960 [Nitrospiraceae bacterium]